MARRNRREAAADSVDIEALPADPDAEIDATVCNCLYRLLPTLKAEYADVIWRADILGEPRDRLAASLGTSLNNVTVRLHRGRKALRMRLEEMCRTCSTHGFLDCRCDEMPLGTERKRLVLGKSVAVRVDFGVRRSIKKK